MCIRSLQTMMKTKLFSAVEIGSMTMKNSINVPPMCMWYAKDGFVTAANLQHYAKLAASGVDAITIEATGVLLDGRISPNCLGIWDDAHAESLRGIVEIIKKTSPDVKVILQLAHAGRKGSCNPSNDTTVTAENGGWQTVAPSALTAKATLAMSRAFENDEVKSYVKAFTDAAKLAVEAVSML